MLKKSPCLKKHVLKKSLLKNIPVKNKYHVLQKNSLLKKSRILQAIALLQRPRMFRPQMSTFCISARLHHFEASAWSAAFSAPSRQELYRSRIPERLCSGLNSSEKNPCVKKVPVKKTVLKENSLLKKIPVKKKSLCLKKSLLKENPVTRC